MLSSRILAVLLLACVSATQAQEFPSLTSIIGGSSGSSGGSNPLTLIPPPEGFSTTTPTGPTPIATVTSVIYSSPTAAAGSPMVHLPDGYMAMVAGAAVGAIAILD